MVEVGRMYQMNYKCSQ